MLDDVIHHEFDGHVALVSSFGANSVVLLHLAASVDPRVPVIFIDTGKMFGSTLRYRDEIVARLGLTDVRVARPDPATLATHDTNSGLWLREPDKCCAIRKVAPLARALCRASTPGSPGASAIRAACAPRCRWSRRTASASRSTRSPAGRRTTSPPIAKLHDLPEHPLVADGFRSIGCMPCTTRVGEGEDERDGRWRGRDKTECGIHFGLAAFETDGSGI